MPYGQSIAPKIVRDTNTYVVTKAAYAHLLAKALVRAGMLFLPAVSSYDVLDPVNEEGSFDFANDYPLVFFFDFPTVEFFTVNGVQYRPFLGMRYSGDGSDGTSSNNKASESFVFDSMARPVLTNDAESFRCITHTLQAGTGGYGLGGGSEVWPSNLDGAAYYNHKWLPTNRQDWASYVTSFSYVPIVVQNILVVLSPGGLVVCTGRGQGAVEFAQYHGFAVMFHGARIPGRARAPINDPNRDRVNPTFLLPFRTTHGEYLTTPGDAHHRGHLLGAQFNVQMAPNGLDPINFYLYNMSNVDKAVYQDLFDFVRNSPRVVGGVGRHILDPIIGIPNNRRGTVTELYGPSDAVLSTSRVSPTWEDFFYFPGMRWADLTAPIGNYEDPDTSVNWWIVPMANTGMRLAINVEGAVDATLSSIPALALDSTESYDLTPAGFASTFPRAGVTFTRNDIQGSGLSAQNFTAVTATNAMLASWTYAGHTFWRRIRMFIPIPGTADPENQYVLRFAMFVRTTQAGAPVSVSDTPYVHLWVNDVFGGVPISQLTVLAGRSGGEHGHTLTEYTIQVPRAARADNAAVTPDGVTIAWHAYDPSGSNPGGAYTIRVENIRLELRSR